MSGTEAAGAARTDGNGPNIAWVMGVTTIIAVIVATALAWVTPVSMTWLSRDELFAEDPPSDDLALLTTLAVAVVVGLAAYLVALMVALRRMPRVADIKQLGAARPTTERLATTLFVLVVLPVVLAVRPSNPIGPCLRASGLWAEDATSIAVLRVVAMADVAREFVWSVLVAVVAGSFFLIVVWVLRQLVRANRAS